MPTDDPKAHENPRPRFKNGRSIHDYARSPIDEGKTLLGNRFLCRSGSLIVVAPSGLGKSTFSIQISILWACGKLAFDIKPSGTLRILIVQSEDDEGDCIEMATMMDHLELTGAEKVLVHQNTEIIHCNHLTGREFVEALRFRLETARATHTDFDAVILNPYSGYLGGDVGDTELNVEFLHGLINPILEEFNVAVIPVCHSPKTPYMNFDKFNPWDFQYMAAGCAAIANWVRAMLVIVPIANQERLFKFVAAKRGGRIGDKWEGKLERYFQHSTVPGLLRWESASPEQKQASQKAKEKVKKDHTTKDVVLKCLDLIEWRNKSQYRIAAKTLLGLGTGLADTHLSAGVEDNLIQVEERPRPRTNPEKFYRRNGLSKNGDHL